MNSGIEAPTRIIMITEVFPGEDIRTDNVSLDFYGMNHDQVAESRFRCNNQRNLKAPKCVERHYENRTILTRKFLSEALRYDTRVRISSEKGSSIIVHFATVDDAISFYRQYLNVVRMSFLAEFDHDIFMYDFKIHRHDKLEATVVKKVPDPMCSKPFSSHSMTAEEFNEKVKAFNEMKSFYSKNDLKKIEQRIESPREPDFVFLNAKKLAVGQATNVILQRKFEFMIENEICKVIEALGNDIAPICATKHGAYTIQALIGSCKSAKSQSLMCGYMQYGAPHLICHDVGNYSIQKILVFDEDYVFDLLNSQIQSIIKDSLGVKVLKRCITLFKTKQEAMKKAVLGTKCDSTEKGYSDLLKSIEE